MPQLNIVLTDKEKSALQQALEYQLDMRNDMFHDELIDGHDIRELATKSDEEIRSRFAEQRMLIDRQLDELLTIRRVLNHIEKV